MGKHIELRQIINEEGATKIISIMPEDYEFFSSNERDRGKYGCQTTFKPRVVPDYGSGYLYILESYEEIKGKMIGAEFNERRFQAAAAAMQGLLANPKVITVFDRGGVTHLRAEGWADVPCYAAHYADALLAQLTTTNQ